MVWYKSWLDTRWRFLICLAVLVLMAATDVFEYAGVGDLLSSFVPREDGGSLLDRTLAEAFEAQQTYRGFVWYNWFRQSWTFLLVAALMGSGSPFAPAGRGLLFTLSLPATRGAWLTARAGLGLGQVLVLVAVPTLAFPLLSPAIGEEYALGEAIVHGLCMFVATGVFFGFAALLSTAFADVWRPLMLTALAGGCLAAPEIAFPSFSGIFSLMAGESYFRNGSIPWAGLAIGVVLAAALLYAAQANVARRDF
jgi:hypothetical protein